MTDIAADRLRTLIDRLDVLASRRLASGPRSSPASTRATQLADHLKGHLRVRVNSLDAPLLVLIVGPTGAGKSTVFNTLAGRPASPVGVLRPTTRSAVLLVHPSDRDVMVQGTLAGIEDDRIRIVEEHGLHPGVALVDAPDIDSIEHANRELADRLVEAADLGFFVTTATRYADRAAWSVLERIRQRGLPLIVIVNRMPPNVLEQREVLRDVDRLLAGSDFGDVLESGVAEPPRVNAAEPETLGITEGDIESHGDMLRPAAIAPIKRRITRLRDDRDARVALAARALAGSLAGLGDLLEQIADDVDHEAIDVEALRRMMALEFGRRLDDLRADVRRGTMLREEALRHWQAFVGADQMTRFFSRGIGRIRGAIAEFLRPTAAPVEEVRAATTDDLVVAASSRVADAARRTATAWSTDAAMADAIDGDPTLWGPSDDFEGRLRARLDQWIEGIATEIAARGRPKRRLAQGASIGVNTLGTGVMLGTFIHTGGLTGAEVGVAAATAFLNQKLLAALFGEAAMVELIEDARRRLEAELSETFEIEQERFGRLLPPGGLLAELAGELRAAAADLRLLRDARAEASKG